MQQVRARQKQQNDSMCGYGSILIPTLRQMHFLVIFKLLSISYFPLFALFWFRFIHTLKCCDHLTFFISDVLSIPISRERLTPRFLQWDLKCSPTCIYSICLMLFATFEKIWFSCVFIIYIALCSNAYNKHNMRRSRKEKYCMPFSYLNTVAFKNIWLNQ